MDIDVGDCSVAAGELEAVSPSPERGGGQTPSKPVEIAGNSRKRHVPNGHGYAPAITAAMRPTVEDDLGSQDGSLPLPGNPELGDDYYNEEGDLDDEDADHYGMFDLELDDAGPNELEVEETTITPSKFSDLKVSLKSFRQEEVDEFEKWMETLIVTCTYDGKEIGRGSGRYVKRGCIRGDFWRKMEKPCEELSSVAFELFDRYGRLKEEYITHPVRKGTGCWGAEVHVGNLFIIEHISIVRDFRRKGVGKAIINTLVAKARAGERKPAFTIVSPGHLTYDVDAESRGKPKEERREVLKRADSTASTFFRSLGFRRIGASRCFGTATDPNHKARTLPASEDFNLPELDGETEDDENEDEAYFFGNRAKEKAKEKANEKAMKRLKEQLPLHHAVLSLTDEQCVKYFKTYKILKNVDEWTKTERTGKNVLHQAACKLKAKPVQWLLDNVDEGDRLSLGRNREGYTPLEALMNQLETERNTREQGMATVVTPDLFVGFSSNAVRCLATLRGLKAPSNSQLQQLKFGCTCGRCIAGFLSPRMKVALLCRAEVVHDMLSMKVDDAESWCTMDCMTRHVAPDIQRDFRTNKSLRQSFSGIFNHAAVALRANKVPSISNLIDIWKNSNEWPPVPRDFYERGGTPDSALRFIFESARDQDEWAGDGEHLEISRVDVGALPEECDECRNDHEFGFVALACGVPGFGQDARADMVSNLTSMLRRGARMSG